MVTCEDVETGPPPTTASDDNSSEADMSSDQSTDGESSISSKQKVIYDHTSWPSNPKICFICKKDNSDKEKLLKCGMTISKSPCPIRFHQKCIRKYNAGDFDYNKLHKIQRKPCCPIHHCSYCLQNRFKSSTTIFDETNTRVSCTECLQSFHKSCIPGGVDIIVKNLIAGDSKSLSETTVCPQHMTTKLTGKPVQILAKIHKGVNGKKLHFPVCCECDKADENVLRCSKCIRSYHADCHRFDKRIGSDGKVVEAKQFCEACLIGEYVRHNTAAVALFGAKFWPCEIVDNSLYPEDSRGDLFKQAWGKPGFATVKWGGCKDDKYACLPHNFICQLTQESFEAVGKHHRDKHYIDAWKTAAENYHARKAPVPPSEYTEIKKSEYIDKISPVVSLIDFHEYRCDCKKNNCNVDICSNIHVELRECAEDCLIKGDNGDLRPCGNRQVTEGRMFEGLEKRSAGGKGFGVYASTSIPKGACIGEYAGEIINSKEKARRIKKLQAENNNDEHHYMMDLRSNLVVDCRHKGNIARFINHSCEPNCVTNVIQIVTGMTTGKDPKYKVEYRCAIFTIKNIREGEELTFDYQMEEHEGSTQPKCFCSSKRCTGVMDGRSRRRPPLPRQRGTKRKHDESLSNDNEEESLGEKDVGKENVDWKAFSKNNHSENESDVAKEHMESKRAARLAKRKQVQKKAELTPLFPKQMNEESI